MSDARFGREEILGRIAAQKEAWLPFEERIVNGIQEVLGVTFSENRIPVYIVPAHEGAFSDPLVMSSLVPPDEFVDILAHELIHRLVLCNAEHIPYRKAIAAVLPCVDKPPVFNHVFVHAVHSALYLDVLKAPERLLRDIRSCDAWPAYKRAWEIVQERGYKELIRDFKKAFADLS